MTTPKPRPTVASVNKKARKLKKKLRKQKQAIRGMKPAITRAHGKADAALRDIADLQAAVNAGAVGGQKAFMAELRNQGMSYDDIRDVLSILATDEELDVFSDAKVFAEFVTRMQSAFDAQRQHDQRQDARLDEHHARLDDHDQRISTLQGRVPAWMYILAVILGIVAGVLWHIHDFSRELVTQVNGTDTTILVSSVADSLWVAIVFGIAVACGVLGLLMQFVRRPRQQPIAPAQTPVRRSITQPQQPTQQLPVTN